MNDMKKQDGFKDQYLFVLPDAFLHRQIKTGLFNDLLVTDIGYFPYAQGHYRERPKGCETAILLYCSEGRGFYSQEGAPASSLCAGQAVLIPPHVPHVYGASGEEPWSVYWMHFQGNQFDAYWEAFSRYLPAALSPETCTRAEECFSRCFRLLKGVYQTEEYYLLCRTMGEVLGLIACGGREAQIRLSDKGGQGIGLALTFMKQHLRETITLEEIAREASFSPSYLHHLFKQSTGYPPIDYFLRMKIQAASKELFFSGRPVKDIALSYGISDPYYFSRLFKRVMGMSPKQYREQSIG